ncbi:hypothetical protein SMC26_22975 [Actinomadura fulvescens]|uniref:Uncharacterized protein n=1 Tax=Actinomadura fulvescens TaxID=46160 RepID=A0ABN3QXS7_9ACTN
MISKGFSSEVEAGAVFGAFVGDGVHAVFVYAQVVLALDLGLVLVLRLSEDAVADLDDAACLPTPQTSP